MQHKGTVFFATQRLNPLFILSGAQGEHADDLGFSPGKQTAAVGPGEDADFAGNRSDFIKAAAVYPTTFFQDEIPADFFLQITQGLIGVCLLFGPVLTQIFNNLGFEIAHGRTALYFFRNQKGFFDASRCFGLYPAHQVLVFFRWRKRSFGYAVGFLKF